MRSRAASIVLFSVLSVSSVASLSVKSVAAQTQSVETDPLTCWWRTDAAGVSVGEPFGVVLTCSVLDTEAARALIDESRLDPAVVQLAPFEVLRGTRAKDIVSPGRRFFQYEYSLRVVAENLFGRDAVLPPLQLSYRLESRFPGALGAAEAVQGRDFVYAMPALPVRILSLVPDHATDIHEPDASTFEQIEDRDFRATLLRGLAIVLFVLGAVTTAVVLLGFARRRAAAAPAGRGLPDAAVLQGVRRELTEIQQASRDAGWTAQLAGRALAALRIAAAYAAGRAVSQTPATPGAASIDGQIPLDGRLGRAALVSGTATAQTLPDHDELREALVRFTAVRYGREREIGLDAAALNEALDRSLDFVDRMASERTKVALPWKR
jgi:hypothetical protein